MRVQSRNKILLMTGVMALLVDPIFFYIPQIDVKRKCLVLDRPLNITTCALRTFLDLFYILHVMLQFRAGFIPLLIKDLELLLSSLLIKDLELILSPVPLEYFDELGS
ncbi:hypothetical protein K1719_044813 [Acacia pycnantha]|nr:hypothetical protein K1719_044813 [Acacia pycnantha]